MALALIFIAGCIIGAFLGGIMVGFSGIFITLLILGDFLANNLDHKVNKYLFHLINKK